MNRRFKLFLSAAIAVAAVLGGASAAYAMLQADEAGELRASGQGGEQADGYLGAVGSAGGDVRARIDAINIKRRAFYTELAAKRGVKIEEAAASIGCELLRSKVGPGQYYRLPDGIWRKRDGNIPVPLPNFCGQ